MGPAVGLVVNARGSNADLQQCVCVCVFYLAEFWQTYVNSGPEAGAQVRGTREDVAKMLIPHKFPSPLLDQLLHLQTKWGEKKQFYSFQPFSKLKMTNIDRSFIKNIQSHLWECIF